MLVLETISEYLNSLHSDSKTRKTLDSSLVSSLKKTFYVLSINTTGPSLSQDSITRIDASKYKNGSLVHTLSIDVTKENEKEAISKLEIFLEDAMVGKRLILITNLHFELDLLLEAFKKYHINYNISFIDFKSFNRKNIQKWDMCMEKYGAIKSKYKSLDQDYSKSELLGQVVIDTLNDEE